MSNLLDRYNNVLCLRSLDFASNVEYVFTKGHFNKKYCNWIIDLQYQYKACNMATNM